MATLTQEEIKRLLGDDYVDPTVKAGRQETTQESRELKLTEETQTLFGAEDDAVRQEGLRILLESTEPISNEEILLRARTKLGSAYGKPLVPGFEKEEFPSSLVLPEPATPEETGLGAAFRPQIRAGSAAQRDFEIQREAEIGASRVFPGIDESKLADMSPEEQSDIRVYYSGAGAAWEALAKENPQASGEQLSALLEDELETIESNLSGEGARIKQTLRIAGPQVPGSLAFKPQVTSAEIPDLSPAQREFLRASTQSKADIEIPNIISDVRENFRVEVEMADPTGGAITQMRPPSEEEMQAEIQKRITKITDLPWWATAEKEKTLEAMEPRTTFTGGKVYPTGATVESPVSWLFRSALSPLNAATALGFAGLEATGLTPLREKVRQTRPEGYREKGVIVDMADAVARNRSGMAEIGEMWDVSTNESIRKAAPIGYGAGFVLDLLVPIDLGAAEVIRAGKTGLNVSRVTKQLTGASDWNSAFKLAGKQLVSDVPVLRNAVKNSGDFRVFMSAEAGRTLTGYRVLKEATEAGDDFVTALGKVIDEVGEGSSFVKAARKSGSAERILADLTSSVKMSRYVDDLDSTLRAVARHAKGEVDAVTSVKDMTRWVRVIAKGDSSIEALLKGKHGLRPMLNAILENPQASKLLRKQIAWERGAEVIAEMTGSWRGIAKNLVMVTPRTWATADQVPEILKRAHDSAIGKMSDELKNRTVSSALGDRSVRSGWKLSSGESKQLSDLVISRYSRTGLLSAGDSRVVLKELGNGFLSTNSLRSIVGAEIDLTAQAMKKGFGLKAAERLEPIVQKELLAPMEARSLTSGFFKRHFVEKFAATPVAEKGLSLNAQKELLNLRRGIASLDKKLRADVSRLRTKGSEFRKLYGIDPDVALSAEDATIHILMGPDAPRVLDIPEVMRLAMRADAHEEMMETILDFYVLYMKKTPSIGDIFRPVTFVKSETFLSDAGQDAMQGIVSDARKRLTVVRNGRVSNVSPDVFRSVVNDFLADVRLVVRTPRNLSKDVLVDQISTLGSKHTEDMLATVFYQTEARRAAKQAIRNIIRQDDIITGSPKIGLKDYPREYKNLRKALGMDGDYISAMERLIVSRGQTQVADVAELGTTLRRGFDAETEWMTAIRAIAPNATDAQIQAVMKSKSHRIRIGEMASVSDNTIEQIIRRNGMAAENLSQMLEGMAKTLETTIVTGRVTEELSEAALGRVNAQLINDSVGEATNLTRLSKYIEGLHKTKDGGRVLPMMLFGFRRMQSFRYNLMLGWRPRFHGNNTITAPTVIQQTLGGELALRTANPVSYAKAADVMATNRLRAGGTRTHKIALVDKAGRIWTYGDVYQTAIESGAMRSRQSYQINQALIDGSINEAKIRIKDVKVRSQVIGQLTGPPKKVNDFVLEMAEIEDNVWRMAVILDSLRIGEDISVAIQKGRISMYDYGALTPFEQRFASQLLMFYTFSRINVTHTLNNLFHHPNRVKNALVLKRDITKLVAGQDADDLMYYAPDWMISRPILNFSKGVDKETYYTVGPGVVPAEGAAMVAEAFLAAATLDITEGASVVVDMLSPELKIILGTGEQWGARKGVIDPRDVAMLHTLGAWGVFQTMIGEEAVGVDPKVDESTFNGRRWVLSDKAWAKYRKLKGVSDYVGATTVTSDATKAITTVYQSITGDESVAGRMLTLGAGEGAIPAGLEFIGATTPIGGITSEQELEFGIRQRQRELEEYKRRTQ